MTYIKGQTFIVENPHGIYEVTITSIRGDMLYLKWVFTYNDDSYRSENIADHKGTYALYKKAVDEGLEKGSWKFVGPCNNLPDELFEMD